MIQTVTKVLKETDATAEYQKVTGRKPKYPIVKVEYEDETGSVFTQYWVKPDWNRVKKRGGYVKTTEEQTGRSYKRAYDRLHKRVS